MPNLANPEATALRILPGLSRETCHLSGIRRRTGSGVVAGTNRNPIVHDLLVALTVAVLLGLAWFLRDCTKVERQRMLVLIVLIFSTVVFWACSNSPPHAMTLFADRVVDRSAFAIQLSASQIGAFNSLFIMLLAPVFAWLWDQAGRSWPRTLQRRSKFGLGIMQAGLVSGCAGLVAVSFPDATGHVALLWLVLAYLLHTTGELCLSPVGCRLLPSFPCRAWSA